MCSCSTSSWCRPVSTVMQHNAPAAEMVELDEENDRYIIHPNFAQKLCRRFLHEVGEAILVCSLKEHSTYHSSTSDQAGRSSLDYSTCTVSDLWIQSIHVLHQLDGRWNLLTKCSSIVAITLHRNWVSHKKRQCLQFLFTCVGILSYVSYNHIS